MAQGVEALQNELSKIYLWKRIIKRIILQIDESRLRIHRIPGCRIVRECHRVAVHRYSRDSGDSRMTLFSTTLPFTPVPLMNLMSSVSLLMHSSSLSV